MEESVGEGIATGRETGGGVLSDGVDGGVIAFCFVEDGTEGGVVLAGEKVGVDAARVDSGEGVVAFRGDGEGSGGGDLRRETGAIFKPAIVVVLFAEIGVEGGVCDRFFFLSETIFMGLGEALPFRGGVVVIAEVEPGVEGVVPLFADFVALEGFEFLEGLIELGLPMDCEVVFDGRFEGS